MQQFKKKKQWQKFIATYNARLKKKYKNVRKNKIVCVLYIVFLLMNFKQIN